MNHQIIETLDGKRIEYTVKDCRSIDFKTTCDVNEYYENNVLTHIQVNGWDIKVGDDFKTWLNDRPTPYKIGFIEKISNGRYYFLTHKRNRTSIYITPCLRTARETRLEFMFDYYLVNSYLHKNKYLDLVYRFSPHDSYKNMENQLTKHSLFVQHIDNGEYTILRFKIPSNYINEVNLFLDGKYSKFSPEYKEKIMKFHGFSLNKNNRILAVLNKYDWLKKRWEEELDVVFDEDIDLDSKPNLEEEETWKLVD